MTDCFVRSTSVESSSKTTTWPIEQSKTTHMLHNTGYKDDTSYQVRTTCGMVRVRQNTSGTDYNYGLLIKKGELCYRYHWLLKCQFDLTFKPFTNASTTFFEDSKIPGTVRLVIRGM